MGNIMWNNNKIMEFDDIDKEYMINYCNSVGVTYIVENENIIIFPSLFDKTLILKAITSNKQEKKLIESIKNILLTEGATVILDEGFMDKSSLEYLDAQIFIIISFQEKFKDLTIYTPSSINKTSTLVAKNLLKQLIILQKQMTYKVANLWNNLKATRYWTYLFGNSTSTLILEISPSALSEDFLKNFEKSLVKSIIQELSSDVPTKNVEEFISTLKSYKNKLDELKTLYINTEEYLQILSIDIQNMSLEELDKIKAERNNDKESECNDDKESEPNNDKESECNDDKESEPNNDKESECNNDEESEVKTTDKKSTQTKQKKAYFPQISSENINQENLNQQLFYPLMYPGESPVYNFKTSKPDTDDVQLPPDPKKNIH